MKPSPTALLRRLERLRSIYGDGVAVRKAELLDQLAHRRLASAREVLRLHDVLCFWRAYPDGTRVLERVERMLATFERRRDLRRHRRALADTGIAGTEIRFRFFWATARWLVRRWPGQISIDWGDWAHRERLVEALPLLLPYSETPALDELAMPPREWISRLKGPDETDAAFLVRRFETLAGTSFGREIAYDTLDPPMRLLPGPRTPSRTRARWPTKTVRFQATPLSRERPDLRREAARPPLAVQTLSPGEGRRLIDLALDAMVTRARTLDAFEHADPRDVRLIDCGDGLQFAGYGLTPERRLLLEACYGFLTLKNGVPVGYVLASALFRSAAVGYNVFETFRGGEAARVFGRVLGMVRSLFGADTFSIDPFQLGHDNAEGLRSGAWWFYYRLGFRPRHPEVRRVLRGELRRMKRDPGHRSSAATLRQLVIDDVFLHLGRPRADVLGRISLGDIGLGVSQYLAGRFGSDRERAVETCAREAAALLGVRSLRGFSPAERLMWRRWAPLVIALTGVERWSAESRHALVGVIRAKGGRRESDFVPLFDRHRPLRRALLRLAERSG